MDGELPAETDDLVQGSQANRRALFIGSTDAGDRNFIGQIDAYTSSLIHVDNNNQ